MIALATAQNNHQMTPTATLLTHRSKFCSCISLEFLEALAMVLPTPSGKADNGTSLCLCAQHNLVSPS